MTVKTEAQLKADFGPGQFRTNTAKKIEDFVDSKFAIGGVLYAEDEIFAVTTNWQVFNVFTGSKDTKGVNEDLAEGNFTIGSGSGGPYILDFAMSSSSLTTGWLEVLIVKNATSSPPFLGATVFKSRRRVDDSDGSFSIPGGEILADGDTIGVAIRSEVNLSLTVNSAYFRAVRP